MKQRARLLEIGKCYTSSADANIAIEHPECRDEVIGWFWKIIFGC